MNFSQIDIDETHIRLTSDLSVHDLRGHVFNLRKDLKDYIFNCLRAIHAQALGEVFSSLVLGLKSTKVLAIKFDM